MFKRVSRALTVLLRTPSQQITGSFGSVPQLIIVASRYQSIWKDYIKWRERQRQVCHIPVYGIHPANAALPASAKTSTHCKELWVNEEKASKIAAQMQAVSRSGFSVFTWHAANCTDGLRHSSCCRESEQFSDAASFLTSMSTLMMDTASAAEQATSSLA
jgi:murein L,D-transpeptidase YcbB/YkuD